MNAALDPRAVEQLRSAVGATLGLRIDEDRIPTLAALLASRLAATGATAEVYLERFVPREDEQIELARGLTVHETYLLRNRDHFAAVAALAHERLRSGARGLRVLSAGCSTGEEVYSLAITLREALGDLAHARISILGVDIGADAISRAREGRYGRWALRETPESTLRRYFRPDGAHHVVIEELREIVRFDRANLFATSWLWSPESYDLVFCRNVLMYFTPSAARTVVDNIAQSLSPGGHLFLGHAENLRGISTDFELHHRYGTFYYERAAIGPSAAPAASAPPPILDGSWVEAIERAAARIAALSAAGAEVPPPAPRPNVSSAMAMVREERFLEALRILGTGSDDPDVLVLRAMLLATTRDIDGAEALCARILSGDRLNAAAHYILSLCRDDRGDHAGAVEHGEVAAYLDPSFAMPRLQLGRLARRRGDRLTARRLLAEALDLLEREDAAHITLFGGGFGREALLEICRSELSACEVSP